MLEYKDLTSEEKVFICNGCGSKGGWIDPPEFIFHEDCNHHDFLYWRGCSEEDREKYDNDFYGKMKDSIANEKWYKRPYYHTLGYVYFKAVRYYGKDSFTYCMEIKDRTNLVQEMLDERRR